MVVMKDGREVDRIVGAMPKPALEARVTPHLRKPKGPANA
jgi:thioredoxin-like negative regulator of GroEL